MNRDRNHSHFTGIPDKMRTNARQAAVTLAQQGLRNGGGGAPNTQPIPHGRAGHKGEPEAPAGTQNGKGLGTSSGDGVELMAQAIVNRTRKKQDASKPRRRHLRGRS